MSADTKKKAAATKIAPKKRVASKKSVAAGKKAAPKKEAAPKKSTAPKEGAAQKTAAASKKQRGAKARAAAVKKILRNVEKKMCAEDVKATLGDYIRLVQLSKEMADEPLTDVQAGWVPEPEIPEAPDASTGK